MFAIVKIIFNLFCLLNTFDTGRLEFYDYTINLYIVFFITVFFVTIKMPKIYFVVNEQKLIQEVMLRISLIQGRPN